MKRERGDVDNVTAMMTKSDLRLLANRNITFILNKLNIVFEKRDLQIQGPCPCQQHGGDGNNRSAFSFRRDYGKWVCFTHHCELPQDKLTLKFIYPASPVAAPYLAANTLTK